MALDDKIWLAVIGGLIGLITAIVTSWLNKRWLADEVAQTSVIENQVEVYRSLARAVIAIHNDAFQLIAYLAAEPANLRNQGNSEEQVEAKIKEYFSSKSSSLLERVYRLKEDYVFLPKSVILSINEL